MVKGKTETGFAFEIDPNVINDMEIVDAFAEIAGGNPTAYSLIVNKLFTGEQKKALYDHVRDENGRVPIEKVGAEINAVFVAIGDAGKNS